MAFLRKNFARASLAVDLDAGETQLIVASGHTLPTISGSMRLTIWDVTNFPDPANDPGLEIVTAEYSGTPNIYNIIRGQEDTSDQDHSLNERVALHYTAGMSEEDIYDSSDFTTDFATKTLDNLAAGTTNIHLTTVLKAQYDAAYSHISSNGSSHSYINQSVTNVSSPTFVNPNVTGDYHVNNVGLNDTNVGAAGCSLIGISCIGTPTYTTQCQMNSLFASAGRCTGGTLSDAGSQTLNVSAGTGFIKATDSDVAELLSFDWNASNGIAIPSSSIRYLGVEYNGGSPQVVTKTSYTWDYDTDWPLGLAINEPINGTDAMYFANTPWWVTDGITNIHQAIRSFGLIRRDSFVGGLMLSVPGIRNIAVTSGMVWAGMSDISFAGLDTSVTGTFEGYWYKAGEGWQSADLTQYSVTQWNDITQTTLQTIDNNKYLCVWVYGELMNDVPSIAILYPQAQYNTAAEADAEAVPSNIPVHVATLGIILGRIIIKQNVAAPVSVESAFATTFTSSVASTHNNLAGLQGGAVNEYYHLTSTEYGYISGVNAQSVLKTASPIFTGLSILNSGGVGNLKIYDQDAAEYLNIDVSNGFGYITVDGSSPGGLIFGNAGNISTGFFNGATEGLTPYISVSGWKTGDSTKRQINIGISSVANNTAAFSGVGAFTFGGSLAFTQNSDTVTLSHDGTDAYFRTSDGDFVFQTDEGTDTSTLLSVKGKGSGYGRIRVYDQDDAEYFQAYAFAGRGFFEIRGSAPVSFNIQEPADVPIDCFFAAAAGETQELRIYGYRTGDAKRSLEIGVGVDAADTASFDGLSNYQFDGTLISSAMNCNGLFTLTQNSDTVTLSHDGTDGYIKSSDGSLIIMTDEGTNTNTYLDVKGKGTGIGYIRIYDQDNAEFIKLASSSGIGYIEMDGAAPNILSFNYNGYGNIGCFGGVSEGNTPQFRVSGFKTGDAKRQLAIGVSSTINDTVDFTGLDVYMFDSKLKSNGTISVSPNSDNHGLKLQTQYVSANTSSRVFFSEANTENYGFSFVYAGNTNPTFDGTSFTLTANTFYLLRHENSVTGSTVLSIDRAGGTATFGGRFGTSVSLGSVSNSGGLFLTVNSGIGINNSSLQIVQTTGAKASGNTSAIDIDLTDNSTNAAHEIRGLDLTMGAAAGIGTVYGLHIKDADWNYLEGYLQLASIKSGASQAGAGAVANEVWKTSGHASLPDNVLMIGV